MKILISSVSTGVGHAKAAEAIQEAFLKFFPEAEIKHINVMDYVTPSFRKIYESGYSFVVKNAPWLWGGIYNLTEKRTYAGKNSHFLNSVQKWNSINFFKFIDQYQPDCIVTTHFLIPQILAEKKNNIALGIPIYTVVTDFDLHPSWAHPIVDKYFVGQSEIVSKLLELGVEPSRIVVSGIPVSQKFLQPLDRNKIQQDLNIEGHIPTILLLSGGQGFISLEQTIQNILNLKIPIQIISVSGHNREMKNKIDRLDIPIYAKLINLGFVENMHELLTVADVVVTKPGGLTLSECLTKGAMILMTIAIPGQEEKNAEYVVKNLAGLYMSSGDHLIQEIKKILVSPNTLSLYKEHALKLSHPNAAYDIAKNIIHSLKKGCIAA